MSGKGNNSYSDKYTEEKSKFGRFQTSFISFINKRYAGKGRFKRSNKTQDSLSGPLRSLMNVLPTPVALLDGNAKFIYANKIWDHNFACQDSVDAIAYIAKAFNKSKGNSDASLQEQIRQVINSERSSVDAELMLQTNELKWFRLEVAPWNPESEKGAVIMLTDITEYRTTVRDLSETMAQKNIFLEDAYHRTKNSLQIVSGLLRMQAESVRDERIHRVFKDCENRIMSMAIVYDKLQTTKVSGMVYFPGYVKTLCRNLCKSFQDNEDIKLHINCEDITLSSDIAMPCGLIINELVTNALKHAFPEKTGTITVGFSRVEDTYWLTVSDDGIGLPAGFNYQDASSLGMKLVSMLCNQLNGTFEMKNIPGAEFSLSLKS